jgi:hypothetical protein
MGYFCNFQENYPKETMTLHMGSKSANLVTLPVRPEAGF